METIQKAQILIISQLGQRRALFKKYSRCTWFSVKGESAVMSLIGCPPKFQYSRHNYNRPCSESKVIPAEDAHSESEPICWICWGAKGWILS